MALTINMKIRLADVKIKYEALCTLGNKALPVRLSYAIGKNIMKLQAELEAIEKARVKLVEQYASKDEEGKIKISNGRYDVGDNGAKVNEEFAELMNTVTDVDIYSISKDIMESMDDTRYDTLTPAEIIALDFMLEHSTEKVIEDVEAKA